MSKLISYLFNPYSYLFNRLSCILFKSANLNTRQEAIHEESGQTSVFAVHGDTVRKIEVNVSNVTGQSLHRIEAVDETIELQGMRIVVEGVHYLIDGQKVAIVGSAVEA